MTRNLLTRPATTDPASAALQSLAAHVVDAQREHDVARSAAMLLDAAGDYIEARGEWRHAANAELRMRVWQQAYDSTYTHLRAA